MYSKTTFAIIAALAASASVAALPTGVAPAPADTVPVVDPAASAGSPPTGGVVTTHPHPHGQHHNHHHRHNSEHHPHRPHHANGASKVATPVSPVLATQGQTATQPQALNRRAYYESFYARGGDDVPAPHHHNHNHHHHPHPNGGHHHHPHTQSSDVTPQDPTAPAPPANVRREYLEERGLLDFLKPHVRDLTITQTTQMNKAEQVCKGLSDKKARKKCSKALDTITKRTKERNYEVADFIKITNHHDVFVASDPSASSSSSSSSTSSH